MKKITLRDKIAPVFYPVHNSIKDGTHSEFWLKGGRGSTKSSFVSIEIVLGVMKHPDANALCLRKVADTLRSSVLESIMWAIDMLGVEDLWETKVSPAEFTYKPTGQKILFKGLDKARKLKSIKVRKGYFKYLWFEELEEYSGMEEIRNVQQSVTRGGEDFVRFFSYNPPDDANNWVNKEVKHNKEGRYVHHSTYLDVPPEWLGSAAIKEAEHLKTINPDKYLHEYMGKVIGRSDKVIFHGRWSVQECEPEEDDDLYFGADFGFANDPSVLLRTWKRGDTIYIDYAESALRLDTKYLYTLYDKVPGSRKQVIRADSSRPETISHLVGDGFIVRGVEKGKGSVEDGINWLLGFNFVVHPRCKIAIDEFASYSYKTNKAGDVLSKIEDENNHAMDALRYAYEPLIKKSKKQKVRFYDI